MSFVYELLGEIMDKNIKIGQLIHRTCSIVDAYVNSQVSNKENGHLTAIEGRTLSFIVNQKQVVTAQDIMIMFHVSKASVSQTLSSLKEKNMIEVQPLMEDKRKKGIVATLKGIECEKNLSLQLDVIEKQLETNISGEEKQLLYQLLEKVIQTVKEREKQKSL